MTPRRTAHPPLTRERIVTAAMGILDDDGVEACSMRRLAVALGVDASSLYYHVQDRAALLDLIVDEILGGIELTAHAPSTTFVDQVVAASVEYRRALLRHPRAVALIAVRPLHTPAQLRVIEALSRIFTGSGFSPVEALIALDSCGMTILGLTNMHAAGLSGPTDEPPTAVQDAVDDHDAEGLSPEFARLLAEADRVDGDLEFERALRALATGLLTLHETGTLAPARSGPDDGGLR
ncbi:MAG: hypothetical protein QG608_146 [Actinomycetota bacterium]|nr:hypothetical protein [Actinomycetota bacterium]